MSITFKIHSQEFVESELFANKLQLAESAYDLLQTQAATANGGEHSPNLGWFDVEQAACELAKIKEIAAEIRAKEADFVLIGVGGSNQAARACIEALRAERTLGKGDFLQHSGQASADAGTTSGAEAGTVTSTAAPCRIFYAGNNLSAKSLQVTLAALAQSDKDVYINIIAKNFATLEPGSHFRIFRNFLAQKYPAHEIADHIIVTGSEGSELEALAERQGARFLTFPERIGGRFSAFSSVGLLPLAVFGLDCDAYIQGALDMQRALAASRGGAAARYAAFRNSFDPAQIKLEVLATFEPELYFVSKWWQQLFGESEGKDHKGLYPATHLYSEDLHSLGQYMQAGQRIMAETFLTVAQTNWSLPFQTALPHIDGGKYQDNFDYLQKFDFTEINQAALRASIEAHISGGVPVAEIELGAVDMYNLGAFYYFNMVACSLSALLLGVNPFDQPGVETYKTSMFKALGK